MADLQIKSHSNYLLIAVVCLFFNTTISAKEGLKIESDRLLLSLESIPSAEEAFSLKAEVEEKQIRLIWDIKENCYLYLHKFSFIDQLTGENKIALFPKGKFLEDEFFGNVEVYFNQVEITLPIIKLIPTENIITYQGCNKKGYCYTPVKKSLLVDKNLEVFIY